MSTVCDSSSLVNTSLGLRNTGVCLQEHWCILSRTYQNASPSGPGSLPCIVAMVFFFKQNNGGLHPPPALHSGTAQSNASLSSLSTPTNLTVATTEVSAAACYYVRGGGEEKESATDKTSCSRARAVRASGCSAYIWWQRQEHPLVSLDALVSATFLFDSSLFNTQHISMCS